MHAIAMAGPEVFLLAMLIIFAIPYLVWRLLRTDGFAPLVVVQIVAAFCWGPACSERSRRGIMERCSRPA